MAAIKYIDVRKGMVLIGDNGDLYQCLDRDLNTPGNWRAILQLKLKNLMTGNVVTRRVHPDNKVEQAYLDKRDMQYLYRDGTDFVFMDKATFDQLYVPDQTVAGNADYMLENTDAMVAVHEGSALYVELPASVELLVEHTDPGLQGDRSTGGTKPARLETGAEIQVPLFLTTGEKIKVDTRDGRYLGRVNEKN